MFSFFKDRIKKAFEKIKGKVEEKPLEQQKEQEISAVPQEKVVVEGRVKEAKTEVSKPTIVEKNETVKEEKTFPVIKEPEKPAVRETKQILPEQTEAKPAVEKKGFFARIKEKITTKELNADDFDEYFYELEIALLESNVGIEVVEQIREQLRKNLVGKALSRSAVVETIQNELRNAVENILSVPLVDVEEVVKKCRSEKRACVVLILGYNGSGKSLSCARLAYYLKDKGYKVLMAAGDTFRSAGGEQLVLYGEQVGVEVVHQTRGADSCAVIFDAVSKAHAKGYDVVIADTAGRLHTDKDLMQELKKIVRVNKPDLKILVEDSLTGGDVVDQVRLFDSAVGVDGLIFTKVDVYEKGGAILSVAATLRKPIFFLGVGQGAKDFMVYNPEQVLMRFGF